VTTASCSGHVPVVVAPGPVPRAYRELESAGLVEARRRGGTVVRERRVRRTSRSQREERLAAAARDLVAATRALDGAEPVIPATGATLLPEEAETRCGFRSLRQ
jgi:DNA-binding transcriptional regulator YhcF (GntR family)